MQSAAQQIQTNIWQPNAAFGNEAEHLESIRASQINLAVWRRSVDIQMLPIIHFLASEPFELEYEVSVAEVAQSLHKYMLAPLEFEQARYRFIADIQRLATIFAEYSSSSTIRLVVESVHNVPCPKFHQDNVLLRLICSYEGVGTEWLENSNVNTHADCCGGSIVRDTSRIQQLEPFDVALMKGRLWPNNHMGVFHRSPTPRPHQPRLIVKMDVGDD